MEVKRTILSFSFVLAAMLAHAQLTLEGCQHSAQTNYPLVRQYGLIEKAQEYNLENAGKGYLPQFTLSGKATYQSDVTKLPVDVPGIDIKSMPKDQYQVMLEVSQNIWDGGDIRSKKQLTRATSEIDRGKQEVDMYALNETESTFAGRLGTHSSASVQLYGKRHCQSERSGCRKRGDIEHEAETH